MSTALYRKYRPQTFNDVLGQKHIIDVLDRAIKDGSIAHAYLFSGSRGTGKTSVARILASAIGTSVNDMYEIDAASNRGIDDIRALREAVQAIPFESNYKVYIIDEVHMLTKEAFNALLKTLEEPPAHAIFVLATTEIHKLPDTVISRCEVHHFKKPIDHILKEYIIDISKKEGYKIDIESAELVALLGDGSFRDSLGILQKIMSSVKGKEINVTNVENVTGVPKRSAVKDVVTAIHKGDLEQSISVLNAVTKDDTNMRIFVTLLLQFLRYVLLLKFAPKMEEVIKTDVGDDTFKFISDIANEKESRISSEVLYELIGASSNIEKSSIPQLPLELALIKVLGEDN